MQHLFDHARRNPERPYAVLYVDLDGFKVFNDTMGSAVGDQVLVEIGRRLSTCLRIDDTLSRLQDQVSTTEMQTVLSRMGGDEFTILLEEVADPSQRCGPRREFSSAVAEPFLVEGREVKTSASVGIALSTPTHARAEDLLQDADVAMRRAKALGGSRCEVFDEAMHTRAVNRLKLEVELRQAIAQGQFRVYYQPIFDLGTKLITGFEALLRWQHPEHGLISPDKFMAAHDSGLLVAAGQWLMQEACKQLRDWTPEIPAIEPVSMSMNVSARQLADARFVTEVEATLRQTGLHSSRLCLEITENMASGDSKLAATVLSLLKNQRVGVILDDFVWVIRP